MGRGGYRRLLLVIEAKSDAWPFSVTILINFWLQKGMRGAPDILAIDHILATEVIMRI